MTDYRPPAHGGQRRWATEIWGRDPGRWLDFSANLNPLGPPAPVLAALREGLGEVGFYPDLEAKQATRAVAAYLGVDPEGVLLTSGGMEALFLGVRAARPHRAVVREPAFGGYREALSAAGVPAVGHFGALRALLEEEFPPRQILVVGQPGNPTGTLEDQEVLVQLAGRLAERDGLLLVDEAFIDFLEVPERHSLRSHAAAHPGLLVVGSLTKFFTLPGLRIGYALAPPPLLAALRGQATPWSLGSLAQTAAVAAVADRAFIAETRRFLPPARSELAAALRETRAFAVLEGTANYLLLDARPSGIPAKGWVEGVARRGILLRDASNFPGLSPYHLRIAVRMPEENERLVGVLREILGEEQVVL